LLYCEGVTVNLVSGVLKGFKANGIADQYLTCSTGGS
jgi:hypothetical protein